MAIIRYQPTWPSFWEDEDVDEFGLDVSTTDDSVVVKAPVPGLKQDQIKVTFEDGVLRISGENKEKYSFCSYDFETTLPRAVAGDKLKAELEDGVLVINAPIAPESKAKQITVTTKK